MQSGGGIFGCGGFALCREAEVKKARGVEWIVPNAAQLGQLL